MVRSQGEPHKLKASKWYEEKIF